MAPPKRPGPGDDASRSKRTKSNVLPLFASSSSSSSAAISEPLIGGGKHTGIGRLLGLSREEEHLGRSVRSFFPAGLPEFVHPERARILTDDGTPHRTIAAPNVEGANCVVYWMSRDQRAEDNWALLYAGACARQLCGEGGNGLPLVVCFNLVPHFAGAGLRQYQFMIEGLQETEKKLRANNIPFVLLQGNDPASAVADFATASSSASSSAASSSSSSSSCSASVSSGDPPQCLGGFRAAAVFTDMSPLRVPMQWANDCAGLLAARGVPLVQVDAANVVPVWVASEKQEVGARTIRRKIHAHLPRYLTTAPPALDADSAQHAHLPSAQSSSSSSAAVRAMMPPSTVDWDGVLSSLSASLDRAVAPVSWARGGETAAKEQLEAFLEDRLRYYDEQRNDPTVVFSDPTETTAKTTSTRRNPSATSDLSPWLKFGHLSAQRAVLETKKAAASPGPGSGGAKSKGKDGFIEEGVVRRELSDNFCFYNERYDTISDGGAANWAAQSLLEHASDEREFLYDEATLEAAKTHDDLWNAAQMQMVREGKMHGFLRMYWAKKILEWTASPDEALRIAIHLNDKYELDGRSPNGYVGCMWSIAGVHDMGWKERPIFGKIRYMNYAGCSRKFDVQAFVSRYDPEASGNARAAGGTPAKPKKSRAKKSPARKSSKVSE